MKKISAAILILLASAAGEHLLAERGVQGGQPRARTPEVATDQTEYDPGSTAAIAGGGFFPGELVLLQVLHADGSLA